MNADEKQCPYCAETIKAIAVKCKHCHSELNVKSEKDSVKEVILKPCPFCAEDIDIKNEKCPHCQSQLISSTDSDMMKDKKDLKPIVLNNVERKIEEKEIEKQNSNLKRMIFLIIILSIILTVLYFQKSNSFKSLPPSFKTGNDTVISKLVNKKMIGTQRQYFEKISGVPKTKDRNSFSYEVEKCTIRIETDKSNNIKRIGVDSLNNGCTFNTSGFDFGEYNAADLLFQDVIEGSEYWIVEPSTIAQICVGQMIVPINFQILAKMVGAYGHVKVRVTLDAYSDPGRQVAEKIESNYPNNYCAFTSSAPPQSYLKSMISQKLGTNKITSIEFFY